MQLIFLKKKFVIEEAREQPETTGTVKQEVIEDVQQEVPTDSTKEPKGLAAILGDV